MGEEKKEEGSKEKEEKKEEEKKEEEEVQEIVLKVDMHCEACARKVARALKGFQGVEKVTADCKASKVVVRGKGADAAKVCERIQKKSGRKVELISPLPKENAPPPPTSTPTSNEDTKEPPGVKKEEPPAVITVVLNVQMHCEACAQGLQKRIRKVKGVESVTTNVANNQVIVKGVVDPEKLVSDVYKRTRKQVSIVKDEEKKEDEKKDDVEKKEVKEEGKKESQETTGTQGDVDDTKATEMKKSEYWLQRYHLEHAYLPQMFSDENPHACSLM